MLIITDFYNYAKEWNNHCKEQGYKVTSESETAQMFRKIARLCYCNENPFAQMFRKIARLCYCNENPFEYTRKHFKNIVQDDEFCYVVKDISRRIL